MSLPMLPDLNHDILKDIGVFKAGHRINIIRNLDKAFTNSYDEEDFISRRLSITKKFEQDDDSVDTVLLKSHRAKKKKREYIKYYVNDDLEQRYKIPFSSLTIYQFKKIVIEANKLSQEFAVFYLIQQDEERKLQVVKEDYTLVPGQEYYVINNSEFKSVSKKILKQDKKGAKQAVSRNTSGKPVYTSENHPMQVDYIPDNEIYLSENGRIGLCMAPGRTKKKKNHDWNRDLHDDLDRIRNFYHCDVLVSLVRTSEMRDIEVPNLLQEVENHGMESIHFPIKDKWVPDSMTRLLDLVDQVITRLKEDKNVVFHCNGGKGRSGTLVVATLIGLGKGIDNSIEICRKTRSGTIKNPLQIGYLKRFKKAWRKRKKLKSIANNIKWNEEPSDSTTSEEILLSEEQKVFDLHQTRVLAERKKKRGGLEYEDSFEISEKDKVKSKKKISQSESSSAFDLELDLDVPKRKEDTPKKKLDLKHSQTIKISEESRDETPRRKRDETPKKPKRVDSAKKRKRGSQKKED
eukprot:TRINITY_DN7358_c0_g1_i1.p1 TRINITY_DN7358_c0_g1~~TRINITY_DN7358_c0_g1_i1.p1  ORF type:complete len:519 (+),score=125.46 TRINITY_DN7358_c0_g1_i1:632-2188(+)